MMQIFAYHEVTSNQPQEIHAVSTKQFSQQIKWLVDAGYHSITFNDWYGFKSGRVEHLPPNPIIITFDDGYLDNYVNALPILLEHNFKATIFLVSGFMGKTSYWRGNGFRKTPLMSWKNAREIMSSGINFGSHTINHYDLTAISLSTAWEEVYMSKIQIEHELGQAVTVLAYPMSRYNSSILKLVQESKYLSACICPTDYIGNAGNRAYELVRLTVLASDTIDSFSSKVRGTLFKRLRWYRRIAGKVKRKILTIIKE